MIIIIVIVALIIVGAIIYIFYKRFKGDILSKESYKELSEEPNEGVNLETDAEGTATSEESLTKTKDEVPNDKEDKDDDDDDDSML